MLENVCILLLYLRSESLPHFARTFKHLPTRSMHSQPSGNLPKDQIALRERDEQEPPAIIPVRQPRDVIIISICKSLKLSLWLASRDRTKTVPKATLQPITSQS